MLGSNATSLIRWNDTGMYTATCAVDTFLGRIENKYF